MEPLHTVKSIFDENNYIRFNNELRTSLQKKTIIWLNILYVVIILAIFWDESKALFKDGSLPIDTIIFFLILVYFDYRYVFKIESTKIGKKIYATYKLMHDLINTYEFYENEFIITNMYGSAKVPYTMLYDIKETKYQFILLIAQIDGYFIDKTECNESLSEYIRQLKGKITK